MFSLSWLIAMMTCSRTEPLLPSSEIGAVHAGTVGIIQLRRKSHWRWVGYDVNVAPIID